jgi:hypothetical protein
VSADLFVSIFQGDFMKMILGSLLLSLFVLANFANAESGGSAELVGSRIKIQYRLQSKDSKGSFQLRNILERNGFKNEDGFVETHNALAPLELYNYLYDNGTYAFTIFLPVNDPKLFVSFDEKGFVAFEGEAAKKLFEVLKVSVPRDDLTNLEQYKFTPSSYCDRSLTEPAQYRCWIDR